MPQNTSISVETAYELLTDDNVTEATFQNIGSQPIYILGTNGANKPADDLLGIVYRPGEGESKRSLADLFPGVAGVNRLWARAVSFPTQVFISHAWHPLAAERVRVAVPTARGGGAFVRA